MMLHLRFAPSKLYRGFHCTVTTMALLLTPPNRSRYRVTGHSPPVSAGRVRHGTSRDHPLLLPALSSSSPARGRGKEPPSYPSQEWISATRRKRHLGPHDQIVVCVCLSFCAVVLLLILLLGLSLLWRGGSLLVGHIYERRQAEDWRHEERQRLALSSSNEDNLHPKIVWLMSFPNSGTSFVIHMTREATNCTTATNYGLEGEIRDQPSVPAIAGPAGENGPWLELLPTKRTRIAETILTKTHCKGFCSGKICGVDKTFHTTRSFMMGCLTGNQGVLSSSQQLHLVDKTYDKSLVKKAIHIFRHPLDNIVARFHLEHNEQRDACDQKFTAKFPKNAHGFRRWCARDDQNRGLLRSHFMDSRLRALMLQIPCFNEFYRYTQWHNLAFETTRALDLPTMVLHYHEFSLDFVKARGRVLDFLELPLIGEGIEFYDGKVYHNYYSEEEKSAIRKFLFEFASAETWRQLEAYDFGDAASRSRLAVSI